MVAGRQGNENRERAIFIMAVNVSVSGAASTTEPDTKHQGSIVVMARVSESAGATRSTPPENFIHVFEAGGAESACSCARLLRRATSNSAAMSPTGAEKRIRLPRPTANV